MFPTARDARLCVRDAMTTASCTTKVQWISWLAVDRSSARMRTHLFPHRQARTSAAPSASFIFFETEAHDIRKAQAAFLVLSWTCVALPSPSRRRTGRLRSCRTRSTCRKSSDTMQPSLLATDTALLALEPSTRRSERRTVVCSRCRDTNQGRGAVTLRLRETGASRRRFDRLGRYKGMTDEDNTTQYVHTCATSFVLLFSQSVSRYEFLLC